jgi:hypothetical protein
MRLYTGDEWAALDEHDRDVIREDRRRVVEAYRAGREFRRELLDELTAERFGNGR